MAKSFRRAWLTSGKGESSGRPEFWTAWSMAIGLDGGAGSTERYFREDFESGGLNLQLMASGPFYTRLEAAIPKIPIDICMSKRAVGAGV